MGGECSGELLQQADPGVFCFEDPAVQEGRGAGFVRLIPEFPKFFLEVTAR